MLTFLIRQKYRDKNIPWGIHFELTKRCNLRCKHCYVSSKGHEKELNFLEIKEILEQLQDAGALIVTFSGGEIFLRKDLPQILRCATQKFLTILLTNGTLITSDKAKIIREAGVKQVEISLYADRSDVHDRITGVPGSHALTMKGLNLLADAGVAIVIKSLIMKFNVGEVDSLKKIASNLGARIRTVTSLIPNTDGSDQPLFFLADKKFRKKHMFQLTAKFFNDMKIKTINEGVEDLTSDDHTIGCDAGRSICSISSSGTVYPCAILPINIGSLLEKPFLEIWHEKPSKELEKIRKASLSDFPECINCDLLGSCSPCLGRNYLENGDIFKCSLEYCRMAHWVSSDLNRLT